MFKRQKIVKLLVFPYIDNPYQDLLYSLKPLIDQKYIGLRKPGLIRKLIYFPGLLLSLFLNRARQYKLIHIHWLFSFNLPAAIPLSRHISYVLTVGFIWIAKLLGYRIVWTVHNVLPHDPLTSNDLRVRKILSRLASAKIVHGAESINMMQELGIDTNNTHIIPHGNLSTVYPNKISKAQARKKLGIPLDATVLLLFGRLEPYKNLEALIPCFENLLKANKKMHLIVAGKSGNEEIKRDLIEYKQKYGRNIHVYDKFTPEKDVQLFFKSSDLDVYPYRKVTTSSAALLSFTFGNTVLAPFMGNFKDMPKDSLYFYDPNKKNDLEKQLKIALGDKKLLATKSKNAKQYADSLSWEEIAKQTYRVYEDVLDR